MADGRVRDKMWTQEQITEMWENLMVEFTQYSDHSLNFSLHKEESMSDFLDTQNVKTCLIKANPNLGKEEPTDNNKDYYILDCEHGYAEEEEDNESEGEHAYTRWFTHIEQLAEEIVDGNLLEHALHLNDYVMELVGECSAFKDVYNINILLKEIANKSLEANEKQTHPDAGYYIDVFHDGFLVSYMMEVKDDEENVPPEQGYAPEAVTAAWICMKKPQE